MLLRDFINELGTQNSELEIVKNPKQQNTKTIEHLTSNLGYTDNSLDTTHSLRSIITSY